MLDYRTGQHRLWRNYRGRLLMCVPEAKVAHLLLEAHDQKGYWAKKVTLENLNGTYWPGQSTDVERYLRGCIACAKDAPAQKSQLLQPIVLEKPLQLHAMDWIGPLKPTIRGNRFILNIMYYASEYCFFSR